MALEAVLLIVALRLGLWVSSFRRVRRSVENLPRSTRGPNGSPSLERVVQSVETASRYVPATTCLVEALSAHALLRRYGHPTALHIGVTRLDGRRGNFRAHAWVESDGKVVVGGGENLSEFTRLPLNGGR